MISSALTALCVCVQVATVDSVRQTFVMDLLAAKHHHVMMCGLSGTAKSTMCSQYMRAFDEAATLTLPTTMHT